RTEVALPFFSGIATSQLDRGDVSGNVARVAAPFREKRQPFRWWITPSTEPPALADILKSHGFRHVYDSAGMTFDLTAPGLDAPFPRDLTIRQVSDTAGLEKWVDVFMVGFARPQEEFARWRDAYLQRGFGDSSPWTHFVALLGDRIVAISSVLVCGELAGVYNVVTLPEVRGRGIGAAVTRAALQYAREGGSRIAALQSSEMGLSVYRAIGFQEVCKLVLYDWRPAY
ncbi:MAG: GNAT family N-acetyltransferase, partial [Thermoanaerobaculia bacterium]